MLVERINHTFLFFRYKHIALSPDDPPGVAQPKPKHSYKTVGCVFNHQSLYANCQVRTKVLTF